MKSKYRKKYLEYLKSDKWQEVRKAKAKEQNYTCERCHKVIKKGFHIHHKTYAHLGNEPLSDLMFLCEDCHKEIHRLLDIQKANKKKKPIDIKACSTCKFSQVMKYSGSNCRSVLYCNLLVRECGDVCKRYSKGEVKKTTPKKKNKRKTARKPSKKPSMAKKRFSR